MSDLDDRTKEKLEHLSTVASQIDTAYVCIGAVTDDLLDAVCCDMHRLVYVQMLTNGLALDIMRRYKDSKNASSH